MFGGCQVASINGKRSLWVERFILCYCNFCQKSNLDYDCLLSNPGVWFFDLDMTGLLFIVWTRSMAKFAQKYEVGPNFSFRPVGFYYLCGPLSAQCQRGDNLDNDHFTQFEWIYMIVLTDRVMVIDSHTQNIRRHSDKLSDLETRMRVCIWVWLLSIS